MYLSHVFADTITKVFPSRPNFLLSFVVFRLVKLPSETSFKCCSPLIFSPSFLSLHSSPLCRCGSAESAGNHPIQHGRRCPNLHHIPAPHYHAQHQAQYRGLPTTGTAVVFSGYSSSLYILFIIVLIYYFQPCLPVMGITQHPTIQFDIIAFDDELCDYPSAVKG